MTLPRRDAQYHTYGDYLIWSRTSGDELIDGTAYVKEPPSPSWAHQAIAVELARQIADALEETPWRVFVAPRASGCAGSLAHKSRRTYGGNLSPRRSPLRTPDHSESQWTYTTSCA